MRRSWFSRWTSGWFGNRRGRLAAETLEQRHLLAADLLNISRMAFLADGVSAPAALESSSENLFIAPQSVTPQAGELVRVRLETQSLDETPITSIAPGNEFVLRAYVTDLRAQPEGVYSAFVDVTYDENLVSSQAGAGDGVANAAPYLHGDIGTATTPGLINEAGGFSESSTPLGGGERLLFEVLLRANAEGTVTFTLDPADEIDSVITVYGDDPPIPPEEVEFQHATLTIGNPLPTLSINSIQIAELDDDLVIAELTVTLSAPSTQDVLFDYATSNGTATAGTDYEAILAGQNFFAPGETIKTINIPILPDDLNEGNEAFTVTLSNPLNATIAQGVGTVTILDDDAPLPAISINDVTKLEGNSGQTAFEFTVSLSAAAAGAVTVNYATVPGSAAADADYQSANGTLTFAPGVTQQTITVQVNGDTAIEETETFAVLLSAAVGATITDNTGQATITNDDSLLPTLTINDPTVTEGDAGFADLIYNVTLSATSTSDVTVDFVTAAGLATSGTDFEAKSGTLTIPAGATSGTITVRVIGDELDESNETVNVNLSNVVGASLIDAQGIGTIIDDDGETPLPTLSIGDVSLDEGDSGETAFVFTVTLSAAATDTVTVNYNTAAGTAAAGTDFVAANGTVTFLAGVTSQTITINALGDTAFEQDETFTVTLADPVGATLADASATGTIENDDEQGPAFSVNDVEVAEGDSGTVNATFTVTLSEALTTQATVNYSTSSGTALGQGANADFAPASGTLTFAPGETTQQVTVAVNGDVLDEENETFRLLLAVPTGAAVADGEGVATIIDNDPTPTLSINNRTVTEGDTGVGGMVFTVTLSAASGRTVTVKYATSDGTATAGEDYNAQSNTLTFAPGVTTQTFNLVIRGDTKTEPNEKLTVTLSEPTGATIADGTGEGTINDNDPDPRISIADMTIAEGDEGTTAATFTVTLSSASGLPVVVNFATVAGTALANSDFQPSSGQLTFEPGQTSKTITVNIVNDRKSEATETFTVNLSQPTFATILDGTATGTITDNDPLPTLAISGVTLTEGDSGTQNAVFTVTLTGDSAANVTVAFATADGTAVAGTDYVAANGTLTFAPGETSKTISVLVNGDQFEELNETFVVNLSNPTQATITTGQATATINNNDQGPIEGEAASVAGSVYVDINQNGAREGNEIGLANVLIRISGTDRLGQPVDRTTSTNAAGDYFFANLLPGQYTLTETHPADYLDGVDTAGTMGGTTANDQIFFALGAGQNAAGYSFGEAGLLPGNITRRNFIVG